MMHARGYTLIELVVALAVLALSSLLMAQGVRFGLRAWGSVDRRLSRAEAVAETQQLLRGRLSQTYPYMQQAGAKPYALIGQATELSFSAPGPHGLAGEMLRYRVYLDRLGNAGALKITWQADSGPGEAMTSSQTDETLLQGVKSATFEYFSRGDQGQGSWMPSWRDRAELPLLVRLNLQFEAGAAGDWPALVIRPRITMPAECRFDSVSRRCR